MPITAPNAGASRCQPIEAPGGYRCTRVLQLLRVQAHERRRPCAERVQGGRLRFCRRELEPLIVVVEAEVSAGASRHHAVHSNLAELDLLDRRQQISFLDFGHELRLEQQSFGKHRLPL